MAEQDNSIFKLFGFELKRAEDKQKEDKKIKTPSDEKNILSRFKKMFK